MAARSGFGAGSDELLGVFEGFGGDVVAGEHAADFVGAFAGRELVDGSGGAAFLFALGDGVVVVGEAGDLGEAAGAQPRSGEHLRVGATLSEALSPRPDTLSLSFTPSEPFGARPGCGRGPADTR